MKDYSYDNFFMFINVSNDVAGLSRADPTIRSKRALSETEATAGHSRAKKKQI